MNAFFQWHTGIVAAMCLLCGCASTSAVASRHVSLSVGASSGLDGDALIAELSARRPTWTFELRQDRGQRLDAIRRDSGTLGICLSPGRLYEADEPVAYLPLVCGELTPDKAAEDLIRLAEAQADASLAAADLGDAAILDIVHASDAGAPSCFSVLPLWLADRQAFVTDHVLAENYMITCARNIRRGDAAGHEKKLDTALMAGWLDMASSLMTVQPDFVRHAFRSATKNDSEETRVFGQGMEAHVELQAGKWTQAQLTLTSALHASEHTSIDWLSDILAMKMYQALYSAPGLSTEVFEKIVPAMYPQHGSFQRLAYRYALVARTCRLAGVLPDVTPEIVESCLPAIDIALSDMPDKEHQDYVYLFERAVSDARHPYLTPVTLAWLRERCVDGSCDWFKELRRTALATSALAAETRSFFENFDPRSEAEAPFSSEAVF